MGFRGPFFSCLAFVFALAGCSQPSQEPAVESRSLPTVSGAELQSFVARSELPVLVEFGVDFQCERCQQMKQKLVEIADKFEGRAAVVRVDFNRNVQLVAQLGGTICPTYVLFEEGQVVRTESFPISADMLESHLARLAGDPAAEQQTPAEQVRSGS